MQSTSADAGAKATHTSVLNLPHNQNRVNDTYLPCVCVCVPLHPPVELHALQATWLLVSGLCRLVKFPTFSVLCACVFVPVYCSVLSVLKTTLHLLAAVRRQKC